MFTPNPKLVKLDYEINSEDGDYLCCWSESLKQDVWLDCYNEPLFDVYTMEKTTEKPQAYKGSSSQNQDWVILTRKEGENKFWTGADQFSPMTEDGPIFINNNGLDIDVDSITSDYNDMIIYSDSDGTEWEMGTFTDRDGGKVELYSHVDSTYSTDTDEDGDDIFAPMPQDAFANIKQLFEAAGYKVKIRRTPPRN